MQISQHWTDQERLAVIGIIAASHCVKIESHQAPSMIDAYDILREIHLITGKSAEFLEANRGQILSAEILKYLSQIEYP